MRRKGKVDHCVGCDSGGMKDSEQFVFQRSEKTWFPGDDVSGLPIWKIGSRKNVYYHPRLKCLMDRNPSFTSDLVEFANLSLDDDDVRSVLSRVGLVR